MHRVESVGKARFDGLAHWQNGFARWRNALSGPMISGLIFVARPGDPEVVDRLADTLSALVPGVAAGLIADAVIVADSASEAVSALAEESGAALVLRQRHANPWHLGAKAARRDWVLCLKAGDIPREGWIRILERFVETARPDIGLARLRRLDAGLPARLAARSERLIGVRTPRAGDLVRRDRLLNAGIFTPRLKPRHLTARLDRS